MATPLLRRAMKRGEVHRIDPDRLALFIAEGVHAVIIRRLSETRSVEPSVSSGTGSGTNRAIGSVIMGGQTLSLLLTLIGMYSIFDDWSQGFRRFRSKLAPAAATGGREKAAAAGQ